MREGHKRTLLYGSAILVVGGLCYAVANSAVDADVATLLGSATVQLQLAYGMPTHDKSGQELTARRTLIDDAERHLITVERLQPGTAAVAEGRGFVHMLRGEFAAAAAAYRTARGCADSTVEQRDVLAFNEARMLAKGGQGEAALQSFQANAQILDVRFAAQRAIEEAAILRQLGRREAAAERLGPLLADRQTPSAILLQVGRELFALQLDAKAETAFEGARAELPIADYHLALLKLRQGDVDSSLQLLERALAALPAEVRRLLRDEAGAWSAVAANARFQELAAPKAATPGR